MEKKDSTLVKTDIRAVPDPKGAGKSRAQEIYRRIQIPYSERGGIMYQARSAWHPVAAQRSLLFKSGQAEEGLIPKKRGVKSAQPRTPNPEKVEQLVR